MTSLKQILKHYSFDLFPRSVGTPYQQIVNNYDELYYFIYLNAPYYPIYISHNAFDNNYIYYQQMMFDLDTDTGKTLEDARQDVLKLYKYFDKYQKNISFSGNGFHFLLKFDNQRVNINDFHRLSYSINTFHKQIMKNINITTNNIVCAEPKHLIRFPGSRHFSEDVELNKRFCIPINIDVLESGLDRIIELSKKHDLTHFEDNTNKKVYKLSDILLNDGFQETVSESKYSKISNISNLPDNIFIEIIKKILPSSLYSALFTPHPPHSVRVAAAIQIAKVIDTEEEFVRIFDRIAFLVGWDDKNNKARRDYQVKYIYRRYGKGVEK